MYVSLWWKPQAASCSPTTVWPTAPVSDSENDRVAAPQTRDGFTQCDPQNIFYLPSVQAYVMKTATV